ncbi:MAG: hypothetical protein OHK0013_03800 [Sandaracinaceae bacterium]
MAEEKRKHDAIQGEILHEYDGILEADNLLPRWWLVTFYGTILFSAAYWFYYDAYRIGDHPRAQYDAMVAAQANAGEVSEEVLASLGGDAQRISAGEALFATNCAVCHGAQGEGNIGPNLTDNAWIHGPTVADIHRTVREGVSTAGMPAWGQTLGGDGVLNVVAYVLSIRDTNRAGRPPQGQAYNPDGSPVGGAAPAEGTAPSEGAASAEDAAPAQEAAPAQDAVPAEP